MRLKTIVRFKDLKHDVLREIGDEFTDTKARGEELMRYEFVVEVEEKKEVAVKKPKKERE